MSADELLAEPYPIVVTRWVCGGVGCTRSYSRRATVEGHMATCWKVPDNRACLSCAHFTASTCCAGPSDECGCRGEREWTCAAGIGIEPGKARTDCPSWTTPAPDPVDPPRKDQRTL